MKWRAEGDTNDKVTPYYKGRLFGDSFVCMPLDNQIFNYMIEAEGRHVVATWALPRGHKDKFCMATPDEVLVVHGAHLYGPRGKEIRGTEQGALLGQCYRLSVQRIH